MAETEPCWLWEKLSLQEVTAATSASPPTWPSTRTPGTSSCLTDTATPGSSSFPLMENTFPSGEQVPIPTHTKRMDTNDKQEVLRVRRTSEDYVKIKKHKTYDCKRTKHYRTHTHTLVFLSNLSHGSKGCLISSIWLQKPGY